MYVFRVKVNSEKRSIGPTGLTLTDTRLETRIEPISFNTRIASEVSLNTILYHTRASVMMEPLADHVNTSICPGVSISMCLCLVSLFFSIAITYGKSQNRELLISDLPQHYAALQILVPIPRVPCITESINITVSTVQFVSSYCSNSDVRM